MGELEFKLNDLNEEIDETLERWEREFKKNHPIKKWINDLFGETLFGYAPHYFLSHRHILLVDFGRQLKWAYQRVLRGWDDRASWSIDWWLNHILPDILWQLKENKHGTPVEFYEGLEHDENYNYGDEGDKTARTRWNVELDKMIAGFLAAKQIDDYEYETEEELETLELVFKNGMKSFVRFYRNLWD